MKKTITGKTIAQCIKDGDIKVGDYVKVDRDVTCEWHEGVKILDIKDAYRDGTFSVLKAMNRTCCCSIAQSALGLTIEVTRDGEASQDKPTDTQAKRTFDDVSAKEQGIDTTRTFVVVSEIVGWPAKSYFPVGARLRLYRDDNTHAPDFCKEEDYTGRQNLDCQKYWYVPWKYLAYADEKVGEVVCVSQTAPEGQQTKQTIMQKLTSALKRALNADLQAQYKAGYINGGLELTSEGKEALLDIAAQKFQAELTAAAKEKIAEEEKESE